MDLWNCTKKASLERLPQREKWTTAGFLEQQTSSFGSWKKRYCILDNQNLFVTNGKPPDIAVGRKHSLALARTLDISLERHKNSEPRAIFKITGSTGSQVKLRATGAEEAAYWARALWTKTIKQRSPTGSIDAADETPWKKFDVLKTGSETETDPGFLSEHKSSHLELGPQTLLKDMQGRTYLLQRKYDQFSGSSHNGSSSFLHKDAPGHSTSWTSAEEPPVILEHCDTAMKSGPSVSMPNQYASVKNWESTQQQSYPKPVQCPTVYEIPDAPPLPAYFSSQTEKPARFSVIARSESSRKVSKLPKNDPLMDELKLRLEKLNLKLDQNQKNVTGLKRDDSVDVTPRSSVRHNDNSNSIDTHASQIFSGRFINKAMTDDELTESNLVEQKVSEITERSSPEFKEETSSSKDLIVSLGNPSTELSSLQSSDSWNAEMIQEATSLMNPSRAQSSSLSSYDETLWATKYEVLGTNLGSQQSTDDEADQMAKDSQSLPAQTAAKPQISPASHSTATRHILNDGVLNRWPIDLGLQRVIKPESGKQLFSPASHCKPSAV